MVDATLAVGVCVGGLRPAVGADFQTRRAYPQAGAVEVEHFDSITAAVAEDKQMTVEWIGITIAGFGLVGIGLVGLSLVLLPGPDDAAECVEAFAQIGDAGCEMDFCGCAELEHGWKGRCLGLRGVDLAKNAQETGQCLWIEPGRHAQAMESGGALAAESLN